MHARNGGLFRRLTKLMREHDWEPIRIKLNGRPRDRARARLSATNRLPYPHISEEFPSKCDTSTPYVIGKIVSRLLKWTAGGPWRVRCVRLLGSATRLKKRSDATQVGKRTRHTSGRICFPLSPHLAAVLRCYPQPDMCYTWQKRRQ